MIQHDFLIINIGKSSKISTNVFLKKNRREKDQINKIQNSQTHEEKSYIIHYTLYIHLYKLANAHVDDTVLFHCIATRGLCIRHTRYVVLAALCIINVLMQEIKRFSSMYLSICICLIIQIPVFRGRVKKACELCRIYRVVRGVLSGSPF